MHHLAIRPILDVFFNSYSRTLSIWTYSLRHKLLTRKCYTYGMMEPAHPDLAWKPASMDVSLRHFSIIHSPVHSSTNTYPLLLKLNELNTEHTTKQHANSGTWNLWGVQAIKYSEVTFKTRVKGWGEPRCTPFALGCKPLCNLSCLCKTTSNRPCPSVSWVSLSSQPGIHSSSNPACYYALIEFPSFKFKFWLSTPISLPNYPKYTSKGYAFVQLPGDRMLLFSATPNTKLNNKS